MKGITLILLFFASTTIGFSQDLDTRVVSQFKASRINFLSLNEDQVASLKNSPKLRRVASYNAKTNRLKAKPNFQLIKVTRNGKSITLLTNDEITVDDVTAHFDRWPDDINFEDGRVFAILCLCEVTGDASTDDCEFDKQEMKRDMRKCTGSCGCQVSDSEILKKKPETTEGSEGVEGK